MHLNQTSTEGGKSNYMSKIIAISNNKGGVGKSTSASNLSAGLASLGRKTLLVDLDSQGNATQSIGINKDELENTIYDSLVKGMDLSNVIKETNIENLKICPSNMRLADAENELLSKIGRENVLKSKLATIKNSFDFIVIDCPPSLGILSVNALVAANSVIIPIESSEFSLGGMEQFITVFDLVKNINEDLEIEGVLMTRVESNTKTFKNCFSELSRIFGDKFYDFFIPRNQAISDAQSPANFKDGIPIPAIISNPSSKGSVAYKKLVEEVIKNAK
jgi:chromosome partitioning protein